MGVALCLFTLGPACAVDRWLADSTLGILTTFVPPGLLDDVRAGTGRRERRRAFRARALPATGFSVNVEPLTQSLNRA